MLLEAGGHGRADPLWCLLWAGCASAPRSGSGRWAGEEPGQGVAEGKAGRRGPGHTAGPRENRHSDTAAPPHQCCHLKPGRQNSLKCPLTQLYFLSGDTPSWQLRFEQSDVVFICSAAISQH